MKTIILIIGIVFIALLNFGQTISQDVIASSGESYTNENISLNWTIGEMVTETYTGSELILSQGFHQGSYTISTIYNAFFVDIEFMVYPNPTSGKFFLVINQNGFYEDLFFEIIDVKGNILQRKEIDARKVEIDVSSLNEVLFYLIVRTKDTGPFKSFQIQKTN